MNLQDFINYRDKCLVCNNQLKLVLHSKKIQSLRYEEDRIIFIFALNPLNHKLTSYRVAYSFGLQDNSFQIEFYSLGDWRYEQVPDFLRDKFKDLHKNLKSFVFYKYCNICDCYNYSSNKLPLDLSGNQMGELMISVENISLIKTVNKNTKSYKLSNNYEDSKSTLLFRSFDKEITNPAFSSSDMINTPLIKISNKEDLIERIGKLLIFS